MRSEVRVHELLGLLVLTFASSACARSRPSDEIYANGRIEGDEVRVAAKIGGRLLHLGSREGESVAREQLLAELSAEELEAQQRQAAAGVAAAQAALAQAEAQVAVWRHHDAKARIDLQRMQALLEAGAAAARQLDAAENAAEEARGQLEVARAAVDEARAALGERRAAEAAAQVRLDERRVVSPLDGVVLLRLVEEGEVVQAGQPLLVLVDPRDLFLKVYVAESQIGKVRLGNPARITVDAFPDRAFAGRVAEVAERAEFTPRDVHMPDERTRLVFAVKIRLENEDGFLKPGMPADARILWEQGAGDG
jgi:HlyD family secretion protein